MYSSSKLIESRNYFDGDADCYCPHCNAEDADIADLGSGEQPAAMAWNYQQARIDALVEALERAQAAERRWHRVASRVHEQACESDVKIDELEAIRAAAEKLVRCKGRYHSEQNYRALAALFGVNTPDLPPLEHENVHYADAAEIEIAALRQRIADLESRTVTFKLPFTPEPSAFAPWVAKAFYQFHKDTVKSYVAVFSDACAAAGIKVEAE
ncbi:ead/Ea22-like family protein [Klebsiella pneumoniae]|nr:ead/Ea22-like family protein [Klebsiella pneumoniae]THM00952.1 ead/Ea22-like family protein [Klebsiella pneumoniae subsp. pneumoniae]HBS4243417.1 ead/Ea22-like family protein [Klebsiella quasipneumoniae subsp. quasipneumoniae]ULK78994.1 ead/Ea22-like family protein [Klebsiella pneumoniae]HBS6693607.1 ead/Ea22-like family protein [Klebsiella pneumoniae]